MARESWTSGELEKLELVRFGCVDGVFVVRCVRVGLLLYSISLHSSNCVSTSVYAEHVLQAMLRGQRTMKPF